MPIAPFFRPGLKPELALGFDASYQEWKFDPKTQLRLALGNLLAEDVVTANKYTDTSGTVQRTTLAKGYVNARASMEMKF